LQLLCHNAIRRLSWFPLALAFFSGTIAELAQTWDAMRVGDSKACTVRQLLLTNLFSVET
jgi:hypothetical protein